MFQSSFFSVAPEIRRRGRKLVVRTAREARVLSLGAVDREVVIDPDRRVVLIRDRGWWSRHTDRIPFDLIEAVTYELRDAWSNVDGPGNWMSKSDPAERYAVGLKLHGMYDPHVHLFWFVGEGRCRNHGPLPDWLYWKDAVLDFQGTQEEDSRRFVTVLGNVLNKPVERK